MKVLQLDVCSDGEVKAAVEFIRNNLEDSQRGMAFWDGGKTRTYVEN